MNIHTWFRPGPAVSGLLWRAKTSAFNYPSACLSLSDPLNDLSACLSVYLSVFVIIYICVRLTLTSPSTCLCSCHLVCLPASLCLACSFAFCHCLPLSRSSLAVFSDRHVFFCDCMPLCLIGSCMHCCSDFCWAEMEILYFEAGF